MRHLPGCVGLSSTWSGVRGVLAGPGLACVMTTFADSDYLPCSCALAFASIWFLRLFKEV